jgi:hypothetical protein
VIASVPGGAIASISSTTVFVAVLIAATRSLLSCVT